MVNDFTLDPLGTIRSFGVFILLHHGLHGKGKGNDEPSSHQVRVGSGNCFLVRCLGAFHLYCPHNHLFYHCKGFVIVSLIAEHGDAQCAIVNTFEGVYDDVFGA